MDNKVDHFSQAKYHSHNVYIKPSYPQRHCFMIFTQIEHERTSREVERQIEKLILEGVLQVGDRLPSERELSKSLNVSRPILREALSGLEKRQLLVTRHGGGTFVADVIGTVFAPPVVELISTHPKAKLDYLEYRREIEGIAASMAASRLTEADKALLERIMSDMQEAHVTRNPILEADVDVEFHSSVGECAHNIILLHTLRSCYRLLSDDVFFNRRIMYHSETMRAQLLEQHQAIFNGVMSGDGERASIAAKDHITFVEEAARQVERKDDWSGVSELRLVQRKTNSKRPKS